VKLQRKTLPETIVVSRSLLASRSVSVSPLAASFLPASLEPVERAVVAAPKAEVLRVEACAVAADARSAAESTAAEQARYSLWADQCGRCSPGA